MGGLTVLAIAFAALFTGEYLTLARTQYFGVYATGCSSRWRSHGRVLRLVHAARRSRQIRGHDDGLSETR